MSKKTETTEPKITCTKCGREIDTVKNSGKGKGDLCGDCWDRKPASPKKEKIAPGTPNLRRPDSPKGPKGRVKAKNK